MMRRLTLFVLLAGALFGMMARPARACSCAGIEDARRTLETAEGAFVGTFVSQSGDPHEPTNVYHFRVDVPVKGELGPEVDVVSSSSGASCGLEVEIGGRIGLFLSGEMGSWSSTLCSQIDPDRLLEAQDPLPPPDTGGPGPTGVPADTAVGPGSGSSWPVEASVVLVAAGVLLIGARGLVRRLAR